MTWHWFPVEFAEQRNAPLTSTSLPSARGGNGCRAEESEGYSYTDAEFVQCSCAMASGPHFEAVVAINDGYGPHPILRLDSFWLRPYLIDHILQRALGACEIITQRSQQVRSTTVSFTSSLKTQPRPPRQRGGFFLALRHTMMLSSSVVDRRL